jgi:cell division transport system permease protein
MVVALTIIQLAVVLNTTANNAIYELGRNLKASLYLVDNVSEQDRLRIERSISQLDFVESVTYISVEQARRNLAEDFNNDTQILQAFALVGTEKRPAGIFTSQR